MKKRKALQLLNELKSAIPVDRIKLCRICGDFFENKSPKKPRSVCYQDRCWKKSQSLAASRSYAKRIQEGK